MFFVAKFATFSTEGFDAGEGVPLPEDVIFNIFLGNVYYLSWVSVFRNELAEVQSVGVGLSFLDDNCSDVLVMGCHSVFPKLLCISNVLFVCEFARCLIDNNLPTAEPSEHAVFFLSTVAISVFKVP
jgi:hypothetical protein